LTKAPKFINLKKVFPPPAVEFHWKLSDIVNAAIRAGFRIERLEEFWVEHEDKKTPLLPTDFLLVAAKEKPS
jgi:hypothetical protein